MAELMIGLAQYFSFHNEKRPRQSLGYQTPDAAYAGGEGGGAMIVDKFGGAGDSSRAQPGQRCFAACEEMDAA